MFSYFCRQSMEGNQGDLDGITSTASVCGGVSTAGHKTITYNWQSPPEAPSLLPSTEGLNDDFGEHFYDFKDPLLHELGDTTFFGTPKPAAGLMEMNMVGGAMAGGGSGGSSLIKQKVLGDDGIKRPCNIFSRVLQVSPGAKASSMVSSKGIKPSPAPRDIAKANTSSAGCLLDHGGLQISSRQTPGIKRRKNQAKKVVCIPAPAAASGRQSGEVVPSDLWAWRKYGQKPIKGSPYPRGYYRCSSSKGCSARKQIERSRTDPNMLVITYTSEHNHPWPTQRNVLAGSTRSQPSKDSSSATKSSPRCRRLLASMKEENKVASSTAFSTAPLVKEEAPETEMMTIGVGGNQEIEHVFSRDNEPMLPESSQSDDFFADLGELESDPMGGLVFSKEFLEDKPDGGRENDAMDPFSSFDWAGSLFGEGRKWGL